MSISIPQRIAAVAIDRETNVRAGEFLALARALAAEQSDTQARAFLRSRPVGAHVLEAFDWLTTRAAQPAATTYDSTWAGNLISYQQASDGFAETLRNASAFDRCLTDGAFLRVPPATVVSVTTAGATASIVGEAAPKPATVMSFTSVQLQMMKVPAYCVISAELMRSAGNGPIALLGRELRGAIGQYTDQYFIAQLTTGLTAIPSSGGASAVAVRTDLRYLMDAVSFGANARLYYITTPAIAKRLAVIGDSAGGKSFVGVTPTGGELDGIPLLVSDAATAGVLLLFDGSQIAASAGLIELDRSNVANLQLDTAPDSPPTASTPYTNLWVQNMSALRAERYLSAQRLRSTAAASISGFTGIGNSPS